jgi:hypothetical protein
MPAIKLTETGVFERSFRASRKRIMKEDRDTIELLVRIRRAALVAQIKREQKQKGAK